MILHPEVFFPSGAGTYALLLQVSRASEVWGGPRYRQIWVNPGWYVYLGSARGSGGLRGRLKHHLRPAASPHWHIDYLRQAAQVKAVWYSTDTQSDECAWAAVCGELPEAQIAWQGFGSSGCRCQTHLYYFPTRPRMESLRDALRVLNLPGVENEVEIEPAA